MKRIRKTAMERLFEKVKVDGECWVWTASKRRGGYGQVLGNDGRIWDAHRLSYALAYGCKIRNGAWVLHKCDNPPCVRPSHLWLGTHQENMNDAKSKGRMPRGEASHWARLKEFQVREIRMYSKRGWTGVEIAKKYSVSTGLVSMIRLRKVWKHI